MTDDRVESGRVAENAVADFLQAKGYSIVRRNYRKRIGEIDLIAQKGRRMHFIEIKSRSTGTGPSPVESWGETQRARFILLAEAFLAENAQLRRGGDLEISLDFAAVRFADDGSVMDIEFIEDAFRPR